MGLSIGLEALNRGTSVMFNMDAEYADLADSYSELLVSKHNLQQLFTTYENLKTIKAYVKKYGYTKSFESLLGTQLGNTTATVMKSVEDSEDGIFTKIKNALIKFWKGIVDFFAKVFNTRRGVILKLTNIKNNASKMVYKDGKTSYKGLKDETIKKIHSVFLVLTNTDGISFDIPMHLNEILNNRDEVVTLVDLSLPSSILSAANMYLDVLKSMVSLEKKAKENLRKVIALDPTQGNFQSAFKSNFMISLLIKVVLKTTINFVKSVKSSE